MMHLQEELKVAYANEEAAVKSAVDSTAGSAAPGKSGEINNPRPMKVVMEELHSLKDRFSELKVSKNESSEMVFECLVLALC